jgi:hypothetical protein
MDEPKQDALSKAEGDVAKAAAEVEHDIEELKHAERDLERAEAELAAVEHAEPLVAFEDVNTLESVDFRTPWHTKLTDAWTEAARLLEEPRKPTDRLQTPQGTDLMPDLQLTLRELVERKIITALKFQIVGPTGGA